MVGLVVGAIPSVLGFCWVFTIDNASPLLGTLGFMLFVASYSLARLAWALTSLVFSLRTGQPPPTSLGMVPPDVMPTWGPGYHLLSTCVFFALLTLPSIGRFWLARRQERRVFGAGVLLGGLASNGLAWYFLRVTL
jgi:hypothetical protein